MNIRLEAYSEKHDRWWPVAWVDFVNKECSVCTDLGASLDLPFETMRMKCSNCPLEQRQKEMTDRCPHCGKDPNIYELEELLNPKPTETFNHLDMGKIIRLVEHKGIRYVSRLSGLAPATISRFCKQKECELSTFLSICASLGLGLYIMDEELRLRFAERPAREADVKKY